MKIKVTVVEDDDNGYCIFVLKNKKEEELGKGFEVPPELKINLVKIIS